MAEDVFAVQNVIGVRVYRNGGDLTQYPHTYVNGILSPLEWYQRNVPNPGSPEVLSIDGYPAIRDGRTIYAAATNLAGDKLYSNIYLISYNEGAEQEVLNIVEQMVNNWRFNVNISDKKDPDYLVRGNIRKDLIRAMDMNGFRRVLEQYKKQKKVYPGLEAGSYQTGWSYSVWPSWQQTLARVLGKPLPQDPVNRFDGCTAEGVDPKTCWNEQNKQFICPISSRVYAYRSLDQGNRYEWYAHFEYKGPGGWQALTEAPETVAACFNYKAADKADADLDGIVDQMDICPLGEKFTGISCDDRDKYQYVTPDKLKTGESCYLIRGKTGLCYQSKAFDAEGRVLAQCDRDRDGVGDACDECPLDPENDRDKDGYCTGGVYRGTDAGGTKKGGEDNCPLVPNSDQANADEWLEKKNGLPLVGDACAGYGTCGNGKKEGYEECDFGDANTNTACVPNYKETCAYCDTGCVEHKVLGGVCGDKTIREPYESCENVDDNTMVGVDSVYISRSPQQCNSPTRQYLCNKDRCQWEGGYCGDGTLQANFGENCESVLGGARYSGGFASSAELGFKDGTYYTCAQCQWSDGYCGDGVIQSQKGEKCDDGASNGVPGFCDKRCSYIKIVYDAVDSWKGTKTQSTVTLSLVNSDRADISPTMVSLPLDIKTPYLWIADSQAGDNAANSAIFRVNLPEGGSIVRINLGGRGVYDPSRTAVDLLGNVWVAGRQSGNVAKITPGGEIKKICSVGNGPRGIAFDNNLNVWIGNYNSHDLVQLSSNDTDCAILKRVALGDDISPYGLASDSRGNIWVSNRSTQFTGILKYNVDTGELIRVPYSPEGEYPYGITVDKEDNVWSAIWESSKVVKVTDGNPPKVAAIYTLPSNARAIGADANNNIWISMTRSNQVVKLYPTSGIQELHGVGSNPIGVSADSFGNIWVVNYSGGYPSDSQVVGSGGGGSVTRININNPQLKTTYIFGGVPYTYSDMAGYMLQSVSLRRGTWMGVQTALVTNPDWKYISVVSSRPSGTSVRLRYRFADSESGLEAARWSNSYAVNADFYTLNLDQPVDYKGQKAVQLELFLETQWDNTAPKVYKMEIIYQ